jgi:hypothetical protein
MNLQDFNTPKQHAFGMLAGLGLSHISECEAVLDWILIKCIEQNSWDAVTTRHNHPNLVQAGLVEEVSDRKHKLTTKAKGLLYSHYGKE